MAPQRQLNDPEKAQLWELALDTMENLRGQVNSLNIEVAVIKTKIGLYSAFFGALGAGAISLFVAIVVFFLKR